MSEKMWIGAFVSIILLALILMQPSELSSEDYSKRQMADAKERECELDKRCAGYNRATGQWVWKPGQQPAPEPIVNRLQ